MDERFELVKKVPSFALRQINAGRLKGKSDISPAWRTSAVTEVYGMCGLGWKYEVKDIKQVPVETGEIMLFMQVDLYIKDKETGEWSAPITGFGGDFVVKREREGIRANDESYKMALTDALGNAMKQIGVANDIYMGLWDGSKYIGSSDEVIVKQKEPQPLYKQVEGEYAVLARDGQYHFLKGLTTEQLNALVNSDKYAEIHDAVRQEMSTRNE